MSAVFRKCLKSLALCNKVPMAFPRHLSGKEQNLSKKDVAEIQIPVPWGHIAGKWWGNKLEPPVIAIHGWQDNANSFDKLIPLLNIQSVVAIDLPGHGLSSHLPEGTTYDLGEHIVLLHRIKDHFKLEKMALVTHSLGAAIGFSYASVFPDAVKWLVNFECSRTLLTLLRNNLQTSMSQGIDAFIKIEKQKKSIPFPTYKLSKMVEMTIEGSLGSITSPEAALILLRRGISEANKLVESTDKSIGNLTDLLTIEKQAIMFLPWEEREQINEIFYQMTEKIKKAKEELKNLKLEDDKYYTFRRDPAVKVLIFQSLSDEIVIEASKKIICPVLSIRAKEGFLFGSTRKLYEKSVELIKENSVYLEHHDINGTHHAHLCTPEILASTINNFVQKYETILSNNLTILDY